MHTDRPITVTEAEFQREAIDRSGELPVVVDLYDDTAPPCRLVGEIMGRLAADYAGRIRVVRVDVPASPRLAQALQIQAAPTLLIFKQRSLLCNHAGALPEPAYRDLVEQALALAL